MLKRFVLILSILVIGLFSFRGTGEAYSISTYGGGSHYGRFTLDRSGNVYYVGYWSQFNPADDGINIYSSNGSSGLSSVRTTGGLGLLYWNKEFTGYVIDGSNNHWFTANVWYGSNPKTGWLYRYDGTNLTRVWDAYNVSFNALGVNPADGCMWIYRTDSGLYRNSGGSFYPMVGPGWEITAFGADYSNGFWAGGSAGQIAVWNGTSWTSKGTIPGSPKVAKLLVNPATRLICAITTGGLYQYDGSNWTYLSGVSYPGRSSITVDGKIFDYNNKYGVDMYDSILLGDGSIYALNVHEYCAEGCTIWPVPSKYSYSLSSFTMTPSPNGMTGQLKLNGTFDGRSVGCAKIQYSTNGSSFSDLGNMVNGDAGSITPTANNYWFRIRWDYRPHPLNSWATNYTNSYGAVPAITSAPGVTNSTGIKAWDASRGRSWVLLSWGPLSGASGYKLQVFDGNAYRLRDIGNVTSWDSRTKLIFPFVANLPENNSVSSDPFRWDATGLDFEDTAVRLYRSTVGTSYDSVTGYYFKVSAYNSWMETTESLVYVILPNATDPTAPTGTISVTVPDGATAPATVSISLSSVVDNSGGSGLNQMRFSNDNASWSGWESFGVTKSWTTSSGEGEKTVYAQVRDNVGNITTFTATFWLGATLTQINNEAMAAKQNSEAARQASVEAKASAEEAKTAAQSAATNSGIAATNAQSAADRSYYTGKYGGNTESVADISGYVRHTQLPAIDSKVDNIKSDIDNLNTTVTNINNVVSADVIPPSVNLKTLSGAVATSGGSINLIVAASDNKSTDFTYSVNGGAYTSLPANGVINVPLGGQGPNVITIRVKDEAGNLGIATIVIRKL